MPRRSIPARDRSPRLAHRAPWLLALAAILAWSDAAAADVTGSDENELLPSLRVGGGLTIYPDADGPSGVFALSLGARAQLGEDGWRGVGLSAEVGWSYIAGALPQANLFTGTLGVDVGGRMIQLGAFGTFMVGEGSDDLAIGGRASARLELLVGIFGGELGYEGLRLGGVLYHGVHVSVALDVGVILYYLFAASDFLSSL